MEKTPFMPDCPIQVKHLFAPLDKMLVQLLCSLSPAEWDVQTVASRWTVKDVAAHLLDGNLRTLSIQRDGYWGERPNGIDSYEVLVAWLNELNAGWVSASRRISPQVLILLHEATGALVTAFYKSLPLDAPALFAVSWAGEALSANWFHLAREYMEKWLHQQQIRDAVSKPGILTAQYFLPFMDTAVRALPYLFQAVEAPTGTAVQLSITGAVQGSWFLQRQVEGWRLTVQPGQVVDSAVFLDANSAWKLFSKSWRPAQVKNGVVIQGSQELGQRILEMVSCMA